MGLSFKIADVFVKLRGDAGELTKDFDNSAKKAKGWEKELNLVGARVTNVFGVLAGSLATVNTLTGVVYARQSANIDDLAKRGRVVGASIGDVQELALAASLSAGVLEGNFVGALQKMTKRVSEASVGLGESREAIKELGLDAQELAEQDPAQMFKTIVGALEGVTDAKTRARLAGKVFDDEGIALANVTTEAIEQATNQIARMGGALSELDAKKVEDANDAVTLFKSSIDLAEKRLTVGLAPAVELVATGLFEAITQGSGFNDGLDTIIKTSLRGLSAVTSFTIGTLQFVEGNDAIARVGIIGYALYGKKGFAIGSALSTSVGIIKDTFDSAKTGLIEGADSIEFLVAEIERLESKLKLRNTPIIGSVFGSDENIEAELRGLRFQLSAKKQLAEIAGETIPNVDSALGNTATIVGGVVDGLILIRDGIDSAINDAVNPDVPVLDNDPVVDEEVPDGKADKIAEIRDADLLLFGAYLEQKNALSEKSLVDINETTQAYAEELKAQEIEKQGALSRLGSVGAVERGKILFGEFQNALAEGAKHSRSLFEFNKAVSMGNAIVSTYEAATNALATKPFWPVGTAMFSSAIATGLSAVSSIARTQFKSTSASSVTPDTPTISSDTAGSVAVANESGTVESTDQAVGGMRVAVYTTPGASPEVQAAQTARSLAHAAELDFYSVDADGRPIYTGDTDDDSDVFSGEFSLAS